MKGDKKREISIKLKTLYLWLTHTKEEIVVASKVGLTLIRYLKSKAIIWQDTNKFSEYRPRIYQRKGRR